MPRLSCGSVHRSRGIAASVRVRPKPYQAVRGAPWKDSTAPWCRSETTRASTAQTPSGRQARCLDGATVFEAIQQGFFRQIEAPTPTFIPAEAIGVRTLGGETSPDDRASRVHRNAR